MPGDRPTPGTVRVGLKHSRAFESVSPELVDSIVRAARSVPVETGETIVREGEPGNSMFVIAQGQVR